MTVEEMVTYLAAEAKRDCDDTGISSACNNIIAALKAGQAMRLATNVKDTRKAYAAWDAATKEEV